MFNSESKESDIKRANCNFLNMREYKTKQSPIVFFKLTKVLQQEKDMVDFFEIKLVALYIL